MQKSCDLAASAGIDAFLWDWYWYEGEDFLNTPLDTTFMNLPNPGVKFALMWANHDWVDVFPSRVGQAPHLWWEGSINEEEFVRMTDVVINRYFNHACYWRVDDKAWFTIFRLNELISGLGGIEHARVQLDDFRVRARTAGAGEIHFNVMGGYDQIPPSVIRALGIDSVGTYGWTDQWENNPPTDLTVDYETWRAQSENEWAERSERQEVDFVPTVAMGWDSTTRVDQSDELVVSVWPYFPVVVNNTPASFGESVANALKFADHNSTTRVVTINAWNEWTEGSYLEPDMQNGTAHLDQLRKAISASRSDLKSFVE